MSGRFRRSEARQNLVGPILLEPIKDPVNVSSLCLMPRHFGFPLLWPRELFEARALNKREICRAKKQ